MTSRTCASCRYWRAGAPSDMRLPVPAEANSDMGACEIVPPHLFKVDGELVPFQPQVHATRGCANWQPRGDFDPEDDEPDGPDDGEPHPARVRQLFPIHPALIAA